MFEHNDSRALTIAGARHANRDELLCRTPLEDKGTTCTKALEFCMLGISDEAKEKGRSTRDALPLRTGDDARAWNVCDLLYAPPSG